jgi:hypothetical protein
METGTTGIGREAGESWWILGLNGESSAPPAPARPADAVHLPHFGIFTVRTDRRLLIVAPDFFIQRCAGEVAEWSKALPC